MNLGNDWKKKAWDILIILTVFAVTGTTSAIAPRFFMPLTGLEKGTFAYVVVYIVLVTPIYQVLLLAYAALFGRFHYFWSKQKLLFNRLFGWLLPKSPQKP